MLSSDESKKASQPLYKQVSHSILEKVLDGTYAPGRPIPSERELCEMMGVSRCTVRQAIQELVQSGHLYRVQGTGTFVFGSQVRAPMKTDLVGAILPHCYKELQAKILSGIQSVLRQERYRMTFLDSDNDYRREAEGIQVLRSEGVKGLIIMPADDQKDSTAISDLKTEGFPFVLVDRRLQDCDTDCVMSENIDGAFRATEYLLHLGHVRIAFVKSRFNYTSSIEDRLIGYRRAMLEYGMEPDPQLVFSYDDTLERGMMNDQLYRFIEENKVSGIVAVSSEVALDVIKMCRERSLAIPDALSLVCFDDVELMQHLEVPLTVVRQRPYAIGAAAARLLLPKMKPSIGEDDRMIKQLYYPVELVIRESCAEPPGAHCSKPSSRSKSQSA